MEKGMTGVMVVAEYKKVKEFRNIMQQLVLAAGMDNGREVTSVSNRLEEMYLTALAVKS